MATTNYYWNEADLNSGKRMTIYYTQLIRCCNTWSSPLHTLAHYSDCDHTVKDIHQWYRLQGTSNIVNTDATRLARLYLAPILSLYILESSKTNKNWLPAKYLPLCLIFQDHWSGIKFTELGQGISFKTKSTQNTTSSRGIHVGFHHGV